MEFKFLTSYLLILFALYYSYKQKLGLEKIIFINSLRAFGQLLLVGYLLVYIFKLKNLLHLIIVLLLCACLLRILLKKG